MIKIDTMGIKNIFDDLNELGVGKVLVQEPLSNHTTFQVGGPCDYMIFPTDYEEVRRAVEYLRKNMIKFMVIGNGSNLLIKDGGIRAVVIKLAENLSSVDINDTLVVAQAGAQLTTTSKLAISKGLAGMEFSSGIPGNIGGAVTMNAGAYGGEMKDIIRTVKVINRDSQIEDIPVEFMNFNYRKSRVQEEGLIVLEATFQLNLGNQEEINSKYLELSEQRKSKQPLEYPSAGSVFKRPIGHFAGKLIDDAGLRGYRYKNAMVSDKHCGFIVAVGPTSFEEVNYVIQHVRDVVKEKYGVLLETEVRIIGD